MRSVNAPHFVLIRECCEGVFWDKIKKGDKKSLTFQGKQGIMVEVK